MIGQALVALAKTIYQVLVAFTWMINQALDSKTWVSYKQNTCCLVLDDQPSTAWPWRRRSTQCLLPLCRQPIKRCMMLQCCEIPTKHAVP
eukprot:1144583-Pelagomonas_calceolata.AAC.8